MVERFDRVGDLFAYLSIIPVAQSVKTPYNGFCTDPAGRSGFLVKKLRRTMPIRKENTYARTQYQTIDPSYGYDC